MADRVAQLNYPKGLLAGQTAIITGSGQDIGAETARLFANEGARVVVCDIDAEKVQDVAKSINSSGGKALAVPGDIMDANYINTLVAKAAKFGDGKVHIIVNNAGYTWDAVIHKMTDKQWDTVMDLHAKAPFQLIRAAAPYFCIKDGVQRNIAGISSMSGAGVIGMMKTIAKEWGPAFNVRANTVAFGYIQTRLTQAKNKGAFAVGPGGEKIQLGVPGRNEGEDPKYEDIPLRRPGSTIDAANAILAVCSPLFSYVTGQTIMVTGGRNM
ncbi:hypothetical protein LCI18_013853 [Fusarium solani-melongenae]|uniref:Uncharacterized protein n=1 Tax=Fusarium solani subsp. cucurbitae TaxID=2747967 RepID=A0ACD3ZS86_FUSSC|nr:hypothetical protein LCI18_013853 [Fusarium solani-melongenae]